MLCISLLAALLSPTLVACADSKPAQASSEDALAVLRSGDAAAVAHAFAVVSGRPDAARRFDAAFRDAAGSAPLLPCTNSLASRS